MNLLKPKTAYAIGLILLTTEWFLFVLLAVAVLVFFNSTFYEYFPQEILQLRFFFSGFLITCIVGFSVSGFVNFSLARAIFQQKPLPEFNKIILILGIIALLVILGNDIRNYVFKLSTLSPSKALFIVEILLQISILGGVIKKRSRRFF